MYHAFIVDDDIASIEAAYRMIPWEELNISKVDKIHIPSGLTERILSEKPHIVFIDIEMGDVSGLDIISECKKNNATSLFVIITGHDNFNYALQAVNIDVLHYLLKPILKDDVKVLTQKLKKILLNNTDGSLSAHLTSKESFNSFFADHLENGECRFIICNLSSEQHEKIKDILHNCLIDAYKIGENKYLFVVANEKLNYKIIEKLNEFSALSRIVCAMSSPFSNKVNVYEYFYRANQLSYNYFLNPKGQLLIEPVNSDSTILKNILDNLHQAIDAKYLKGIEDILTDLPKLFIEQKYTMSHIVHFYNAVISRLNIIYKQNQYFSLSQEDEEELVAHFQNFKELCTTLLSYISEIVEFESAPIQETNVRWENILEYIEKNFNRKIQAQDICKEFYMSERTFYYLFKSKANMSFVEYLTRFRIEKAKKLLLTSNMPVQEVSESVGIKDHYYFNRIFKKHTGTTPSNFKNERSILDNVKKDEN